MTAMETANWIFENNNGDHPTPRNNEHGSISLNNNDLNSSRSDQSPLTSPNNPHDFYQVHSINEPHHENQNNQPHLHHQHHQSLNNDNSFLNFDSPGGNSDVSQSNLSIGILNRLTPNLTQAHLNNSSQSQNNNSDINYNHHTDNHDHNTSFKQASHAAKSHTTSAFHDYLDGNSPIGLLANNLNNTGNGSIENDHHQNAKEDLTDWATLPDLQDIEMNFFPTEQNLLVNNDLDQHLNNEDHQRLQNKQINNGYQLKNRPLAQKQSVPPTPQSFEVSTFGNNNENNVNSSSFLAEFQSPLIDNHSQTSIRPDVVFTPLVSPAVTPLDAMINKTHSSHHQSNAGFFSPLTSPALEAKSPVKFKKSSSPEDSTTTTKKYSKRKTPGNTPIVGPTIPGRVAKQSPIIKAKRSSSYASNISYHHHQQQQSTSSSSYSSPTEIEKTEIMAPPKQKRNRKTSTSSIITTGSNNTSTIDQSPKLPPTTSTTSSFSSGSSGTSGAGQPATPATLMNFKLDPSISRTSASPVILPSNGSSRRSSSATILPSSAKDVNSDESSTQDVSSKKTSHKLAEQGRRNRMNQAILDLSLLIPEELATTVTIPSKATTVELATKYIKDLQSEVNQLKLRLQSTGSDIISNESVSPLETTDH